MKHWFSDVRAFRRDPLTFLRTRAAASEDSLVRLHLGPAPIWLVNDPELVKPIVKADEAVIDKGRLIHKLKPIVGESSLVISGAEHKRRREVLQGRMRHGFATATYATDMVQLIRPFAAQAMKAGEIDVCQLPPLAIGLVSVALFGRNALGTGDERALVEAVNMVEADVADSMFRVMPLMPWQHRARERRRRAALDMMLTVVRRVRARAGDSSFLAGLIELGLDETALRDEIITMLLAGHHTTGSAAAWLVYHLATEPDLAPRLAEEARGLRTEDGELDGGRLKTAELSAAVVREVLRLWPSAWWFSREVRQATEIGGRRLTSGTSLIIAPWQMHRDARYWPAPDRFDPARNYSHPAYIPFGTGPRACLGMSVAFLELQLLALELASAFEMVSVTPDPAPWPEPAVTLIPPPLRIAVRPRERRVGAEAAA